MSMCKTNCGREAPAWSWCCDTCCAEWMISPECKRVESRVPDDPRSGVAIMDFCTRIRAERLNGGRA